MGITMDEISFQVFLVKILLFEAGSFRGFFNPSVLNFRPSRRNEKE
jgi:hypothetical protein